jgi:hypothetical protein
MTASASQDASQRSKHLSLAEGNLPGLLIRLRRLRRRCHGEKAEHAGTSPLLRLLSKYVALSLPGIPLPHLHSGPIPAAVGCRQLFHERIPLLLRSARALLYTLLARCAGQHLILDLLLRRRLPSSLPRLPLPLHFSGHLATSEAGLEFGIFLVGASQDAAFGCRPHERASPRKCSNLARVDQLSNLTPP